MFLIRISFSVRGQNGDHAFNGLIIEIQMISYTNYIHIFSSPWPPRDGELLS